jgi:type IV secretory pathway TraG/TraD family ATPase VirD4
MVTGIAAARLDQAGRWLKLAAVGVEQHRRRPQHQPGQLHQRKARAVSAPGIKELPDDELIFYEGCKPIRAKKNWFFKDANFKKRASIEPVKIVRMGQASVLEAPLDVVEAKSDRAAAALRQ